MITALQIPEGYKQTELGVIPEDWEVKKIKNIGEVITGSTPPTLVKKYWDGAIPWITPTDISEKKNIYNSEREISESGLQVIRKLPANTLLVTCIASIGKNAILRVNGSSNQQINAIIPNQDIDVDFLYYMIENSKKYLLGNAGITATLMISKKTFSELSFTFPEAKSEQSAIATVLSDTDALIEHLDKLIAKKKAIKQGAMQQLLTGKKRLPGFSGEWKEIELINYLEFPITYGVVTAGIFQPKGFPMLRGGDIKNGKVNKVDVPCISEEKNREYLRTILKKNDVVIALVGYPGESAMIPDCFIGANISRAVGLLRINGNVCIDFIVHFLNSPIGRKLVLAPSAGSAQVVVNLKDMNKLRFAVPEISEQITIAVVLSDMDRELEKLEQKREKYALLKQGMMQVLLTGKIRLI